MNNFKEYVIEHMNAGKSSKKEVIDRLLSIGDFDSFDEFKDVVKAMIEVEEFRQYYNDKIIGLIHYIYSKGRFPKDEIENFIYKYFLNEIPLGEKYTFFYELYQEFKHDKNFVFPISEKLLKNICFLRFERFVNSNFQDIDKCFNLYYLCRDYVDEQNRVVLEERAHPVMRQFISNNAWGYIDYQIRPYGTPIYKSFEPLFTIEPFVEKTFGNWVKFWEFIDEYERTIKDDKNLERFKKYYAFFTRFAENRYKPVLIPYEEWGKYGIDELVEDRGWQVVG